MQKQEANEEATVERVTGSTGLSIGTHLMLESLFDVEVYDAARAFKKIDVNKYERHVYNIYTIIRNILGSRDMSTATEYLATPEFVTILQEELQIIAQMYNGTKCKPEIFYPNYDKLIKEYNRNKEDIETVTYKLHIAIRDFLADYNKKHKIDCINNKDSFKLKGLNKKTLLTTHIGLDLFNSGDFFLLESHTGALKSRVEFSTKYRKFGENDMSFAPWTECIYFVLGDHVFVKGAPVKYKRKLLNILKERKVNVKSKLHEVNYMVRTDTLVGQILYMFTDQYGVL